MSANSKICATNVVSSGRGSRRETLLLDLGNCLMDGLGHIVDVLAGQTAHVDATTGHQIDMFLLYHVFHLFSCRGKEQDVLTHLTLCRACGECFQAGFYTFGYPNPPPQCCVCTSWNSQLRPVKLNMPICSVMWSQVPGVPRDWSLALSWALISKTLSAMVFTLSFLNE